MAMEEIEEVIMEETNLESQIGDDFYETIEAPKFVDLTAPDHRPIGDDRNWFCARVGCDQKHEEEMDSEAIYKDFVLRVMAARSPSVRLRKALCRKDSSTQLKCPNTVPSKPLRSRISKLAMISSIPQKGTGKTKPRTGQIVSGNEHDTTPKAKGKRHESLLVEAKALTTPGKQQSKHMPNPGSFRSVRNPRNAAVRVSKNRIVAKALVFHSPKKTVKLKRSVELRSSVKKKICDGMRKLEIAKKRNVLGFDSKAVRSDQSRKSSKPLKAREVKSRVFDSLHPQKHNGDKAKCSVVLKERVKEKEDALDGNKSAELWETEKHEEGNYNNGENDQRLKLEQRLEETKDHSATKESDLENSKQHEEASETEEDKENALALKSDEKENNVEAEVVSDRANEEEEAIESDDKENASASDFNRKADNVADSIIKREAFGKKGSCKTTQKVVATTTDKCSNGKASYAGTRAHGVKYTKPKPTNPKPFRLRTDERRILKEANTERTLLGSNVGNSRQKHEIQASDSKPKACKGSSKPLERINASTDQDEISERAKPHLRKQNTVSQGATSSCRMKKTPMRTTPTKGLLEAAKESSQMILEESKEEVATAKESSCRMKKTVPKGPNFHSIHIPKSCTKRLLASET